MINPQWLELPMSRTNFHGPKDVRATEIQLYKSVETDVHTLSFTKAIILIPLQSADSKVGVSGLSKFQITMFPARRQPAQICQKLQVMCKVGKRYLCHTPTAKVQMICFVLKFYGPVSPIGSCQARSVYLTTRLLGRLSPLSG